MISRRTGIFAATLVGAVIVVTTRSPVSNAPELPPAPGATEAQAIARTPETAPPTAEPRPRVPGTGARPGASRDSARAGREEARTALAAWHDTFVDRCWRPSAARSAEPAQIALRFNLAFDRAGSLVGLGISESRAAFRPDVASCLRGLGIRLQISAPGAPLQVEVPYTLP